MSAATSSEPCLCVECRIRQAIAGEPASAPFQADIYKTLAALGEVTSELLAHVPSREAKVYAHHLLDARKKWQSHPRVAVQATPAGHA